MSVNGDGHHCVVEIDGLELYNLNVHRQGFYTQYMRECNVTCHCDVMTWNVTRNGHG